MKFVSLPRKKAPDEDAPGKNSSLEQAPFYFPPYHSYGVVLAKIASTWNSSHISGGDKKEAKAHTTPI